MYNWFFLCIYIQRRNQQEVAVQVDCLMMKMMMLMISSVPQRLNLSQVNTKLGLSEFWFYHLYLWKNVIVLGVFVFICCFCMFVLFLCFCVVFLSMFLFYLCLKVKQTYPNVIISLLPFYLQSSFLLSLVLTFIYN